MSLQVGLPALPLQLTKPANTPASILLLDPSYPLQEIDFAQILADRASLAGRGDQKLAPTVGQDHGASLQRPVEPPACRLRPLYAGSSVPTTESKLEFSAHQSPEIVGRIAQPEPTAKLEAAAPQTKVRPDIDAEQGFASIEMAEHKALPTAPDEAVAPQMSVDPGIAVEQHFDLPKIAERKAAPSAIAFQATGLLDAPLGLSDSSGEETFVLAAHIAEGAAAPGLRPSHRLAEPIAAQAGPASQMQTAMAPAPRSAEEPGTVISSAMSVSMKHSRASDGDSSPEAPALTSSPETDAGMLTDVQQSEQFFQETARRGPSPDARRAELVAALLPVSVTLHAADDGAKLAVRLAAGSTDGDSASFGRTAMKILASEGFGASSIIVNGNPQKSPRRDR